MSSRLAGKTCLVTGARQGIGLAVAERFAAEGARVIATDLDVGDEAGRCSGVEQRLLNVTNAAAVAETAARYPEVSVLVNCVGQVANGTVLDCSLDEFDRIMVVNVRSMVLTSRAFLPAMLERGEGSIINVASVVSSIMAVPDRFAYGTSKAAVIGLTMSIARDFIDKGIRCNAISPGTVDSPSLRQRFAATGDAAAAEAAFIARQPMGRLGQPDEIAATAAFLASDEARYISGSNIVIDGGMSL